jgi:hypothetical protein
LNVLGEAEARSGREVARKILEKAIETCIPDNKTVLGNTYKIVLKCKELDEIHKIFY